MEPPKKPIWSGIRKLQANFVPLAFGIVVGAWVYNAKVPQESVPSTDSWNASFWGLACFVAVSWTTLALKLLSGNASMKSALTRSLQASIKDCATRPWFVGMATPSFSSILDPHEDIGFLIIEPERVRFVGETKTIEMPREAVKLVRSRFSIHTAGLVGRWISLEGTLDEKEVRLMLEPRGCHTMIGDFLSSRKLKKELETWLKPEPQK